jgi:hypothetical protein
MQPTRRDVIGYGALALASMRAGIAAEESAEVNDIHSQLDLTRVARVVRRGLWSNSEKRSFKHAGKAWPLASRVAVIPWAGNSSAPEWFCWTPEA